MELRETVIFSRSPTRSKQLADVSFTTASYFDPLLADYDEAVELPSTSQLSPSDARSAPGRSSPTPGLSASTAPRMKLDGLLQATSLATPNGALRFCYQCGAKLVAACRDGGIIKKVFPKFCTECGEATNEAPPSVAQTMSLSREAVFDGVMAPTTGSPAAQEHPAPVGSSTDADELHPPDQLTARLLEGVKIVSDVYRRAQVETEAAARTGGQALAIELAQLEAQKEALEVRRTRIRTHTRARNSCAYPSPRSHHPLARILSGA